MCEFLTMGERERVMKESRWIQWKGGGVDRKQDKQHEIPQQKYTQICQWSQQRMNSGLGELWMNWSGKIWDSDIL